MRISLPTEISRNSAVVSTAACAGVAGIGGGDDFWDATFRTVAIGCQAAMRVMVPQGSGSIINVSSAAIDYPAPSNSMYAMSKAGVAMLTMGLAVEAAPHRIRVNAIAPGVTLTAFTMRHMQSDGGVDPARYEARVEELRRMSPLGLLGTADDQALLILYLASDASRFATGAIFRANGGVAMPW